MENCFPCRSGKVERVEEVLVVLKQNIKPNFGVKLEKRMVVAG